MMRYILFAFLLLLFLLIGDSISKRKLYFADKKLEMVHDQFLEDCKKYGVEHLVKKDGLMMLYKKLNGNTLGVAAFGKKTIFIDSSKVNTSEALFWIVAYHELGHYYLSSPHIKCETCIMNETLDPPDVEIIWDNFEFYKEQMFKQIKNIKFKSSTRIDDVYKWKPNE